MDRPRFQVDIGTLMIATTVVAIALGIPIGSFLVFEKWFLVPMPKGPLEQWLGY